jgi:ABC-type branched-subunit amino acid transport system substrate-binding protein
VDSFFQRYKKKPSKNTLYGYDTAEMLLSTIRSVGNSREALASALQQVKDYRGLHGRIGFSAKRVNSWVWVLRYAQERIDMVDGFYIE